jgi:uncharacterized protein
VRVVLDTNLLVSALIRRNSVPGQILEAWFEDRFILLIHPFLLEELHVTRRPRIRALIRPSEAGRLVNQIRAIAAPVTNLPATRRSADPADDFLLAMSKAGHADYLVTGDKRQLLVLGRHDRTVILNSASLSRRADHVSLATFAPTGPTGRGNGVDGLPREGEKGAGSVPAKAGIGRGPDPGAQAGGGRRLKQRNKNSAGSRETSRDRVL